MDIAGRICFNVRDTDRGTMRITRNTKNRAKDLERRLLITALHLTSTLNKRHMPRRLRLRNNAREGGRDFSHFDFRFHQCFLFLFFLRSFSSLFSHFLFLHRFISAEVLARICVRAYTSTYFFFQLHPFLQFLPYGLFLLFSPLLPLLFTSSFQYSQNFRLYITMGIKNLGYI